jgi:hypothetical protein
MAYCLPQRVPRRDAISPQVAPPETFSREHITLNERPLAHRALSIGFGQDGALPANSHAGTFSAPCYGKGWERAFQVFDLLM